MKKPTKEQVKEFWEGYKYTGKLDYIEDIGEKEGKLVYVFPPINLITLFQYAMPALGKDYYIIFQHPYNEPGIWLAEVHDVEKLVEYEGRNKDPALALFWALYKVMEASK